MPENLKLFDCDSIYGRLPERFYHRQPPVSVKGLRLVALARDVLQDSSGSFCSTNRRRRV